MDNAFIADSVIVLILAVGALVGAKRGLIKSLMGVFVVVGALFGALLLMQTLTEPLTDALASRVEERVLGRVSDELGKLESGSSGAESDALTEIFEKYGLPSQLLDELLDTAADIISGAKTIAQEKTSETLRGAVSIGVRSVVRKAVQAGLLIGGFLVLMVVLGLLAKLIDRVFDLPLLDLTNAVGGALMGLLEAGATIFVLLFFASRFGVTAVTDCAEGSRLMPFFLLRESLGFLPTLNG